MEAVVLETKSENITEEQRKAIMRHERLAEGYKIVQAIHKAVIERGIPEMTMEEIDEEIAACRRERQQREKGRK